MRHRPKPARGFTLIEAMFLLVVLSIVAVGAGIGLQSVAKVPANTDQIMAINNAIVDSIEQWKAKAWASQVSQTDAVTINNKSYTRTISVANADPSDPETGANTQADFHRITVQIGSQTMRSYVVQP